MSITYKRTGLNANPRLDAAMSVAAEVHREASYFYEWRAHNVGSEEKAQQYENMADIHRMRFLHIVEGARQSEAACGSTKSRKEVKEAGKTSAYKRYGGTLSDIFLKATVLLIAATFGIS